MAEVKQVMLPWSQGSPLKHWKRVVDTMIAEYGREATLTIELPVALNTGKVNLFVTYKREEGIRGRENEK